MKSCPSRNNCFVFRQGLRLLAPKVKEYNRYTAVFASSQIGSIGSTPISVVSVVVVDIASSVYVPCVVGIATVRRTQPTVLCYSLHPFILWGVSLNVRCTPRSDEVSHINHLLPPVHNSASVQMKQRLGYIYQR